MTAVPVPEFITYPEHRERLEGAQYVVFIDRYAGSKEFGIHTVNERTTADREAMASSFEALSDSEYKARKLRTIGAFTQYTVGLFNFDRNNEIRTWLVFGRSCNLHQHNALPADLLDYIGEQIIPLEWKQGWAANDPKIMERVEVYVA